MQINSISFGKKIPKHKCQIQDRETGKFVDATFYEIDCKDEKDSIEISRLSRKWSFKDLISDHMAMKHAVQTYLHQKSNSSFYTIQDENNEIVGISEINKKNGIYDIKYIESEPRGKYAYIGQSMISSIGKELLKQNGRQLIVSSAIDEAIDFYKKLGFTQYNESLFRINQDGIKNLINSTDEKTQKLEANA